MANRFWDTDRKHSISAIFTKHTDLTHHNFAFRRLIELIFFLIYVNRTPESNKCVRNDQSCLIQEVTLFYVCGVLAGILTISITNKGIRYFSLSKKRLGLPIVPDKHFTPDENLWAVYVSTRVWKNHVGYFDKILNFFVTIFYVIFVKP